MNELKNLDIEKMSIEEIAEHKKNVLVLESEEIIEYLTYALDTYYKTEEDGENSESVTNFFDTEEFKPFYDTILHSETEVSDETETK